MHVTLETATLQISGFALVESVYHAFHTFLMHSFRILKDLKSYIFFPYIIYIRGIIPRFAENVRLRPIHISFRYTGDMNYKRLRNWSRITEWVNVSSCYMYPIIVISLNIHILRMHNLYNATTIMYLAWSIYTSILSFITSKSCYLQYLRFLRMTYIISYNQR